MDRGRSLQITACTLALLNACSAVSSEPRHGEATHLEFVVQPGTTISGADSLTPTVEVAVLDAGGATVTSASDTISLEVGDSPNGGYLSGRTAIAAARGIARFPRVIMNGLGGFGYTLRARSPGLVGAESVPFNVVSLRIVPAQWLVRAGNSFQFRAMVLGTSDTTVAWSTNAGTVDSTGYYRAPSLLTTDVLIGAFSVPYPHARAVATAGCGCVP